MGLLMCLISTSSNTNVLSILLRFWEMYMDLILVFLLVAGQKIYRVWHVFSQMVIPATNGFQRKERKKCHLNQRSHSWPGQPWLTEVVGPGRWVGREYRFPEFGPNYRWANSEFLEDSDRQTHHSWVTFLLILSSGQGRQQNPYDRETKIADKFRLGSKTTHHLVMLCFLK